MATVAELDAMGTVEATEILSAACGSSRWVREMIDRRPFGNRKALLDGANDIWSKTQPGDWHEAFSHHPRIGEKKAGRNSEALAANLSSNEQSGMNPASDSVNEQLAAVNREYEDRFGHIYIVCATGKNPDELLSIARARLANDAAAELRNAAEEQRKITRIRLEKIFSEES